MTTAVDGLWEEIFKTRTVVNRLLQGQNPIKILEVGCGDRIYIKTEADAYRVGIDISAKQLERNPLLQEKILGDIQTYYFPEADFDLIVFWWVVEHLPNPELAIQNCQKALKKDGVIVIATANVFSIKGLITKFTPHPFHTWVYRHIFQQKAAGTNDHPPFETFLRFSLAPDRIQRFAKQNNFSIEYFSLYEDVKQKKARENFGLVGIVWQFLKWLTKVLTFGKLEAELTDYVLVLRQQQENLTPVPPQPAPAYVS